MSGACHMNGHVTEVHLCDWLLFILLRMVPMVWTVKNAVTAVMPMDVTTLLVTATVWLAGRVRPNNSVLVADLSIHSLNTSEHYR